MAHHKNLCDGLADLESKAFNPMHVRDNPKIYIGRSVRVGKSKKDDSPSKEEEALKGDLLIRDIWTQVMDSIHNMRVMNSDATSYQ